MISTRTTRQCSSYPLSPLIELPVGSGLHFMFEIFLLSVRPYIYVFQPCGVAIGFTAQALSLSKLPPCLMTTEKSLNVVSGMWFTHAGKHRSIQPCSTAHDLFSLKWQKEVKGAIRRADKNKKNPYFYFASVAWMLQLLQFYQNCTDPHERKPRTGLKAFL